MPCVTTWQYREIFWQNGSLLYGSDTAKLEFIHSLRRECLGKCIFLCVAYNCERLEQARHWFWCDNLFFFLSAIPGGPIKTEQSIQLIFQDFALINRVYFTLLDRTSFPHYNNTKIIKFSWELFILRVISYGLSFSGFARFPEFRGTINVKLMANPKNDSP